MDKYAIINVCDWGSTGKIAKGLHRYLLNRGLSALFCYGRGYKVDNSTTFRFNHYWEVVYSAIMTKLTGKRCAGSTLPTKRLIKRLRKENIKNLFLLNLHDHYLDEKLLLEYIAKDDIHLVYIMIDEHAFLGNCVYRKECGKLKDSCHNCHLLKTHQKALFGDVANKVFKYKKEAYAKIKHVAFVGPEFVIKSAKDSPLLEGKRTEIIDEAIDTNFFHPHDTTELREKLGISKGKVIIGCVAPMTQEAKGCRYLIEAAKKLEGNNDYVFVHVGYNIDDKSNLPSNYIPIGFVKNQNLLAQYYSLPDLFLFPSIQDTMPNACLESLSSGTPLLCFNISGMPYIADETTATFVEPRNVDALVNVILKTKKKTTEQINTCREYALKRYDNEKYNEKLLQLVNSL